MARKQSSGARPELIYHLTHPELPVDFPPIHTAQRTGNLPLQLSSFVGRAGEWEQTVAVLGAARVVTLTGTGGVGKTRLALQVASQVAPRFSDGACRRTVATVSRTENVSGLPAEQVVGTCVQGHRPAVLAQHVLWANGYEWSRTEAAA